MNCGCRQRRTRGAEEGGEEERGEGAGAGAGAGVEEGVGRVEKEVEPFPKGGGEGREGREEVVVAPSATLAPPPPSNPVGMWTKRGDIFPCIYF